MILIISCRVSGDVALKTVPDVNHFLLPADTDNSIYLYKLSDLNAVASNGSKPQLVDCANEDSLKQQGCRTMLLTLKIGIGHSSG